jgi:DNA-binding protein HU-beta
MAKMTQTQIIAKMSEKSGLSKKQVKEFITDFVDLAYSEAKKGEFAVPGLGKLVKQKRKARLGRQSGDWRGNQIPAKTV